MQNLQFKIQKFADSFELEDCCSMHNIYFLPFAMSSFINFDRISCSGYSALFFGSRGGGNRWGGVFSSCPYPHFCVPTEILLLSLKLNSSVLLNRPNPLQTTCGHFVLSSILSASIFPGHPVSYI